MKFNLNLEDIKYVKILYQDRENKPCSVKAAIKSFTGTEILCCAKFEESLYIKTPQEITLSFVCLEGLYRTKTVLQRVENDEPYTFFSVAPPQNLEYQQNREYFRVEIALDCIYSYESGGEFINIDTRTTDISANGVSIITPNIEINTGEAYLNISVFNKKIKTKVKFIRSEKVDSGYKISFSYKDITERDRDLISQICIQKQLEEKRKHLK